MALVRLDPDHPGFRDPAYRARRKAIARLAFEYQGGVVPDAPYSAAEHAVWSAVWARFGELHARHACREFGVLSRRLGLDPGRIPQLATLNSILERSTGFRMEPVAGLIEGREFLARLGDGIFLATQYVRHPSRPFYTPEPDVIHELVGHAATLMHPGIAGLSRAFGSAAQEAGPVEALVLERVYWYTLEFGAIAGADGPKAFGAGLLSSSGEIERFAAQAELRPWNLESMAASAYDPTAFQERIYVAPSFHDLIRDLRVWLAAGGWRRESRLL